MMNGRAFGVIGAAVTFASRMVTWAAPLTHAHQIMPTHDASSGAVGAAMVME
jgi:hypothetical protein